MYWKVIFNYTFTNWNKQTHTVDGSVHAEDKASLHKYAAKAEQLVETYVAFNHIENMICCLELKYELLHLAGETAQMEETSKRILTLIDEHDLNGYRKKFLELTSGGTHHEKFIAVFTNHVKNIYRIAVNSDIGEYMLEDLPKSALVDKDVTWSIDKLMNFHFPE